MRHQDKPQLHLLAMPHTELNINCSWCAFSMLARNMAKMMTRQGYRVILYAGSETDTEYTENIVCHPKPDNYDFFVPPWTQEYFKPMTDRITEEMRKRIKAGDLILVPMGVVYLPVTEKFPNNTSVEICVGYAGATAPAKVFPSEAWRHEVYGKNAGDAGKDIHTIMGWASDTVIPHMLDVDQFPEGNGGDYLLFVGRLQAMKGEEVAAEVAKRTGIPLKVVGAGTPPEGCEYIGVVKPEQRAELMGNALAVIAPSLFPEPFNLVAIEAQMVGTPAITTNWGAFTETVKQGVTGYRCYTLNEFVQAAKDCKDLDRKVIRERAIRKYSLEAIGPQYTKFFERLQEIMPR